jgi:CubicO group peptidase (beta-lactamase class C family)
LHLAWALPLALLGYLVWAADGDLGFLWRVLRHRESSTADYRWKRAARVAPAPVPRPWPTTDGCGAVAAAWADDGGDTFDRYLGHGDARALVVIRDGALACEWYGNGGGADRPQAVMSVSKTVLGLIVARAEAAGRLALTEPITARLPELARRDPRFGAITLAALLDMRSGIGFDEATRFPWVDQDGPRVYYASDLRRTVLTRPRVVAPPGGFHYNDYAPNLVGLALERATATPLAVATQALWDELGAAGPAQWSVDDRGFAWHESGLVLTARDLARIGQLILDDGVVAGRAVAPPAWIARSRASVGRDEATRFAGVALGYHNGWWRLGEDLVAMGRYGQIMVVAPATRTVIVRLGGDHPRETNVALANRFARLAARLGYASAGAR